MSFRHDFDLRFTSTEEKKSSSVETKQSPPLPPAEIKNTSLTTYSLGAFTIDRRRVVAYAGGDRRHILPVLGFLGDLHARPFCLRRSFNHNIDLQAYFTGLVKLQATPHPSVLTCKGIVRDGDEGSTKFSALFEAFEEDLSSFITRRGSLGQYLSQAELLWISRQLAAAFAVWHPQGVVHGNVRLANAVYSRNGQKQTVFKLGRLCDEQLYQTLRTDDFAYNFATDMLFFGFMVYELITMRSCEEEIAQALLQSNPRATLSNLAAQCRVVLNGTDVRQRYSQITSLLDLVCQLLDNYPNTQLTPKNCQIALAAMDVRGLSLDPSVPGESTVPAGSGDFIVKTAQQGDRECQYQLALLLRERGHLAQCVAWGTKAVEQGDVRAQRLVGLMVSKGEGCAKDIDKAVIPLRAAAEQGDIESQQALAALGQEVKADWSIHSDTRADIALRLEEKGGDEKQMESVNTNMVMAAEQGCPTAQLWTALKQKESKKDDQADQWFQRLLTLIDMYMTQGNGRGILAAVSACLPSLETIHPFQITGLTNKAGSTAVGKLAKKNMDITAIKLPRESVPDMVQFLLRLPRVPKHPNLLPILGVSGDLVETTASITRTYPLAAIVPHASNRSMVDLLEASSGTLSAEQLSAWAFHLVSGLKALHDKKLVHGNISASNIWINDKQEAVLGLGDFPDATEQLFAGDIFALGLILFVIATNQVTAKNALSDRWKNGIKNETEMKQVMGYLSQINEEDLISQFPASASPAMQGFYQLIVACLSANAAKRPTLQQLQKSLAEITNQPLSRDIPDESDSKPYSDQLYHQAMKLLSTQPKFALQLLREAAAAGHRNAQLQAADILCSGKLVPQNLDEAACLCKSFSESLRPEELYARAMNGLANNPAFALLLLREAANAGHQEAQAEAAAILYEGTSVPMSREEAIRLCKPLFKSMTPEQIDQWAVRKSASSPRFAFMLLCEAANAGFLAAQTRVADICWKEMYEIHNNSKPAPENKEAFIRHCVGMARQYWSMATANKDTTDSQRSALQERLEALVKFESELPALPLPIAPAAPAVAPGAPVMTPAEKLRLAFQHFFGLDVLRNLELSRDFLVQAAEGKASDPNAQLARSMLSLSTNPLDEKCALRFFVPGDDFQPPFVELETTVYRVPGRAYRCSIVGRIAVLVAPSGPQDAVAWLNRTAHAHPNVIGPIGMTAGVRVVSSTGARDMLSLAMLYAPVQAAPADRAMVADPTTATSRLLPFLVGIAEGMAHLHRSNVMHGNVSPQYMLVGHDRLGLIAVGPPSCIRATAPESLASNRFSSASDVFHFGLTIAFMLTGGSPEDNWLPQAGEVDPKTRLARLAAAAANGFQDLRQRIPTWCPAPLVDIMMRCLRFDPAQRPAMDAVATELQTLRSTLAHQRAAEAGPRQAQFWMHTSHICLELTADEPMLREGGIFECLYGPRIRDRMRRNHNPSTNRVKTIEGKQTPGVMHSKSFGTSTGPSSVLAYPNLAAGTRKIIEHKARYFQKAVLSSWDGSEVLPRGIRHLPGYARGAMLMDDKRLTMYVDRLDRPPCYPFQTVRCSGEPEECKCERATRPKNANLLNGTLPVVLTQLVHSFLEMGDYAALAGVCKFTAEAAENNMFYWRRLISEYGNQGQTYVPEKYYLTDKTRKKGQEEKTAAVKKPKQAAAPSDALKQWDPLVRRWAKIIGTQQVYTRVYTSLQLETTDVLHIPDITREERKHLIDKAHNEYKAKKHACGLDRQSVQYAQHFSDQRTKAVGGIFMACGDCLTHNVWTTPEASSLFGFTMKQLEKIPFWRFSTSKRFCTADLDEFRWKDEMRKKLKRPKKIDKEVWDRYPDLPASVREFVFVYPAHPRIPQPQMIFAATEKNDGSTTMVPGSSIVPAESKVVADTPAPVSVAPSTAITVVTDRAFAPLPDKYYVVYHNQGFFAARSTELKRQEQRKAAPASAAVSLERR